MFKLLDLPDGASLQDVFAKADELFEHPEEYIKAKELGSNYTRKQVTIFFTDLSQAVRDGLDTVKYPVTVVRNDEVYCVTAHTFEN